MTKMVSARVSDVFGYRSRPSLSAPIVVCCLTIWTVAFFNTAAGIQYGTVKTATTTSKTSPTAPGRCERSWTGCLATCGPRAVKVGWLVPGSPTDCEPIIRENCNLPPCPTPTFPTTRPITTTSIKDCQYGPWTPCTVTCGNGIQTRKAFSLFGAGHCRKRVRNCFVQSCTTAVTYPPPNCEWSKWSACSVTCGMGKQYREKVQYRYHGLISVPCPSGREMTTKDCWSQPISCEQDCIWGQWSQCNAPCERKGTRSRVRIERIFNTRCSGDLDGRQSEVCYGLPCTNTTLPPPIDADCYWSTWSNWSSCSCTSSTRTRTRYIMLPAKGHGKPCYPNEGEMTINCWPMTNPECTTDYCVWSRWTCDCTTGVKRRYLQPHGPSCNQWGHCSYCDGIEELPCTKCTECDVTQWSAWSDCTALCGSGIKYRRREIKNILTCQLQHRQLPELNQTVTCIGPADPNGPECTKPCDSKPWSSWSTCQYDPTSSNRGCFKERFRITADGSCHRISDSKACRCTTVPPPCFPISWTAWSPCQYDPTSSNRGCFKERFQITSPQVDGRCHRILDSKACRCTIVPPPCFPISWTAWSPCQYDPTPSNRGCVKQRFRITSPEADGRCHRIPDSRACGCPSTVTPFYTTRQTPTKPTTHVDCGTEEWSAWGSCSAQCGPGTRERYRYERGLSNCIKVQKSENCEGTCYT